MTGVISSLIYYRMLHELRRIFHRQSPIHPKIGFICSAVLAPSSLLFSSHLSAALLRSLPPGLHPPSFFLLGTIGTGALFYLFSMPDLFREAAFARDKEFLGWCPILPRQVVPYRMLFGFLRVMPFSLTLISFPFFCLWSMPALGAGMSAAALAFFFAGVFLSALCTSLELIRLSKKLGVSCRSVLVFLSIGLVLAAAALIPHFFDMSSWMRLSEWFGSSRLLRIPLPLCLPLLAAYGLLVYWRTIRIWPYALTLAGSGPTTTRLFPAKDGSMPANRSWAIARKDLKTLWRDPTYRNSVLASTALLVLCLLAEWKQPAAAQSRSWRRLMGSLSLVYLIPLLVSARTVSLELRVIELYRLTLPQAGRLLDLKWMTQSIVNCLLVAALGSPYFLLISPGARPREGSYFVACDVACVPLLTLLAITLGAFFPSTSQPPNPIGITPFGIAAYIVLSVTLYSFLLNYMVAGAAIYAAFLLPFTLLFYRVARSSLSRPG